LHLAQPYVSPRGLQVEEITLSYTFFEAKDTESLEESVKAGYLMPEQLVAERHKYTAPTEAPAVTTTVVTPATVTPAAQVPITDASPA
jgi:hypothetical protein